MLYYIDAEGQPFSIVPTNNSESETDMENMTKIYSLCRTTEEGASAPLFKKKISKVQMMFNQ